MQKKKIFLNCIFNMLKKIRRPRGWQIILFLLVCKKLILKQKKKKKKDNKMKPFNEVWKYMYVAQ